MWEWPWELSVRCIYVYSERCSTSIWWWFNLFVGCLSRQWQKKTDPNGREGHLKLSTAIHELVLLIPKHNWDGVGPLAIVQFNSKMGQLTTEIAILNSRMTHWNFNYIGTKWKMVKWSIPWFDHPYHCTKLVQPTHPREKYLICGLIHLNGYVTPVGMGVGVKSYPIWHDHDHFLEWSIFPCLCWIIMKKMLPFSYGAAGVGVNDLYHTKSYYLICNKYIGIGWFFLSY